MKQFFKFMFASMLGVLLSSILLLLICFGILAAIVSSASGEKTIKVPESSILHMSFKSKIKDRTSDNPFADLDFSNLEALGQPGLNDILKNIDKAATDKNIKGIYLDLTGLEGGMATIEEIRSALLRFKKSEKFILAYSDVYSQGSYYLATTADEIWLNPQGAVEFRGFSARIPFLKGLFEKLEIEPQVIRHGKFKSAVEPFILDKMSPANREQIATFINAFWNHYVTEVSVARKIEKDSLLRYADQLAIRSADDALQYHMVDKLGYMDEFISLLKTRSDRKEDQDLNLMTIKKYTNAPESKPDKEFTRDKIAVIYAGGNIVGGKGQNDEIGSESLSETIRKARKDDKVKAVVLRVNSPGGDALASEVIWREVDLCRKAKPVIVSMGDVAASGGYYISCAADRIVAEPNTVTGSIGVFGLLFNTEKMFKNKLGVTFDSYATGTYTEIGNPTRPLSEAERDIIQNEIERVYGTFTKRVADGRKLDVTMVDSLGQGRVWSGVDALRIGLVDTLGGLGDAIKIAATKAGLENYRISELPEKKDPIQQLFKELEGDAEAWYLQNKLGEDYVYVKPLTQIMKLRGVQARTMVERVDF